MELVFTLYYIFKKIQRKKIYNFSVFMKIIVIITVS